VKESGPTAAVPSVPAAVIPDSTESVWFGSELLGTPIRIGVDPIVVRTLGVLAEEI
jgi:hypothetical protein